MNPLNNMNITTTSKLWNGSVEIQKVITFDGEKYVEQDLSKTVFENDVLIGGLIRLQEMLYKKPVNTKVDNFESELYASATSDPISMGMLAPDINKIQVDGLGGFNIAIDGAFGNTVLPYTKHRKGYDFDNLVPFRMINVSQKAALFPSLRATYLHHRHVIHNGVEYIQFFTKRLHVSSGVFLDDGSELPNNPDATLETDLGSMGISYFPVVLDSTELTEWFDLTNESGSKSTCFSATLTMMGKPGVFTDTDGKTYESLIDSVVFSRANHCTIAKGVKGTVSIKYSILHI